MTSTAAWPTETTEKINFTKLCRLLYDGGTQALRSVFDVQCPPSSLVASLNSNKPTLLTLKKPRGKVLNDDQWDKLYPPPGGASPKSEDFDITLLFVLLRNICPGLAAPSTGWDKPPNPTDNSLGANLVRIKLYRNKAIAHSSSADIEKTQFTKYWNETSTALVSLGLQKDDIDKLKSSPLGEKDYNGLLKEWAQADEDIKSQLQSIKSDTAATKCTVEEIINKMEIKDRRDSPINKLASSYSSSVVKKLVESYHPNTREWIFEKVRSYLERESSQSIMVVIEAGPGMGKSVVAAKICDMYNKSEGQRIVKGACHFFKHNNALQNDPRKMLQSIARQLCESVPGYRDALERSIQPTADKIPQLGCRELFTLLLEEPCSKVNPKDTVVVVIDALDECNNMKNELCMAFIEGIPRLPSWIRFVITTRPPPSISSFRTNSHIYIKPEDANNKRDLKVFIEDKLKDLKQDSSTVTADHIKHLVDTTEGIFLVAFFLIDFLSNESYASLSEAVKHFLKGHAITSVYEDYFDRLKEAILPYIESEEGFFRMLHAIVEAKFPIEKDIFYEILGLVDEPEVPSREREEAINLLHQVFPVENDHVSAFHKTVIDWLTTGEHIFKVKNTKNVIANKCCEVLADIKQGFKNLEEPPTFTSRETHAILFGNTYMESPSFDDAKRDETQINCFLVCSWLLKTDLWDGYFEKNALELATSNQKAIRQKLQNYNYHGVWSHFESCRLYQPKTLKQMLEPILQVLHLLDINGEIQLTPKPIELLKEYGLPYNERQIIMEQPKDHSFEHPYLNHGHQPQMNAIPTTSVEILPCDKAFFLVQYQSQRIEQKNITLIQKYQLDGKLVIEETFLGHKKMFMSPDHEFIVAIPVLTKENIEIIDATTLKMHTSYKSPNVVRSCHVYGSQPWYILIRCFNNKIYVIEGETGSLIHQPVDVDQFDDVAAVGSLGHIVLSRIEILASSLYTSPQNLQSAFTDQEGTFYEEMTYRDTGSNHSCTIQKLYLCHFDDSHKFIKMRIYPKKEELCNCMARYRSEVYFSYFQSKLCFSNDGQLFAFVYNSSTTVLNTSDGSVYCSVSHKLMNDAYQILCLRKNAIVFHDQSSFFSINLKTKEMECVFLGVPKVQDTYKLINFHIVPGFQGREMVFLAVSIDFDKHYKHNMEGSSKTIKGLYKNLHIYKYSIFDLFHGQ